MARIAAVLKTGVGDIEFGTSREEVHAVVDLPCEPFMEAPFDDVLVDGFGAFHVYYDTHDAARRLRCFRNARLRLAESSYF
ncbi:hypothetical protein [Enorma phocaeensis]|uniref:Uncharacterized protein n=1 Tax=Enorma phocaeensis TaxID=1871019 RepID=A0A921IU07_9ACTN|nr:hypothetical protein [Enorma phocaeensis]HJG36805.1 hypothetical protein [Enorma phocaeensis]